MSNELQEIKNLIVNLDGKMESFKSDVNLQFKRVDEQFKGVAELLEHQNEYIDKKIDEVGKENRRHLEILSEQHKHEIQAVGEQYKSLYNKVKEHDEILSPLSR